MKKLTLILSALMIFSFFTACDDDADAPSLALTEVEDSYYGMFCDNILNCENETFFSLIINDEATCNQFLEENFANEQGGLGDMIDAVNDGTINYDGEAAHTCLEEQQSYTCEEFGNKDPEICKSVFTGTIEEDGACEINEECISSYCDTSEACPGVCKAAILEGRTCDIDSECESGAKCINYSCQVYDGALVAGNDCQPGDNDWCGEGLFCHEDNEKCEPKVAIDGDCDGMSDGECVYGSLCMETAEDVHTCVEVVIVDVEGDVCDSRGGIMCAYYADLTCQVDDFEAFTGTCVPTPGLGDLCFDLENLTVTQCSFFDNQYCDTDYSENGYCTAMLADGAVCDGGDCIGFCNEDNVCESDSENMCE